MLRQARAPYTRMVVLTLARTASSMGVIEADMVEERLDKERNFRRSIDITHLWKLGL